MKIFTCPDEIVALFSEEARKPEGRRQAIEWAKRMQPEMAVGDTMLMPDAETGALLSFTKHERELHS